MSTFEDFEFKLKPLKAMFEFYGNETAWAALFRFSSCIYEKVKLLPMSLHFCYLSYS